MASSLRSACVMGWPVEHSRSPLIHRYWLQKLQIAGDYRREAVRPEDFPAFLATLAERGYVGGNVTIPLKEIAFAHSAPDAVAAAVGAANTLWFEGGKLLSTNTDVAGFLENLDEAAPGWSAKRGRACVIGAGGSARAVIFALLDRGFEQVEIVNRSLANAELLARRFGPAVIARGWGEMAQAVAGAELLVNASPLGMNGQPELTLDLSTLAETGVVTDLVYVPLRTRLLQDAEAAGKRAASGLGMLLHQAKKGFELWFGARPQVTQELRSLVEAEILRDKQAISAEAHSR